MSLPAKVVAHWPAISALLDQAMEVGTHSRAAWLENLGSEHETLKSEVGRLLVLGVAAKIDEDGKQSGIAAGDEFGAWRLVAQIGEGGMATVWLAERSDGRMSRPVAVKLPRTGWQNRLFCERLERERSFLDALEHPNIARLLDAGITAREQPYLVLEFVEGIQIDEYFRENKLGLTARLEIFQEVVRTIAFAHGRLVLHRDLKPSNIMITAAGRPCILDFGVAKLLNEGKAEETELTHFAGRPLTLDYASPEQISGRPLTVASDVYSLGVILYELLTGRRPYRLKRNSAAALEEQILEAEPRPPSETPAEKPFRRALSGDLDRVILKALKKTPEERYATAEAFAEDIQRYLQKHPVLAQPDRAWYRLSKFLHRHKRALLAGAALAVVLLSSSLLIAWQAHAASMQKQRAEGAKTLLLSLLLDAHAYRGTGKPVSALDLLRLTQQRLGTLHVSDARTRVEVLNILGASLLSQQDNAGAEAAINEAVAQAGTLKASDAQFLRARLMKCWVLWFRGETVKAGDEAGWLVEQMTRYGTPFAEDFAGAWRVKSETALEQGDAPRAASGAKQALKIAEAKLGVRHNQSVLGLVDLCLAQQQDSNREQALHTCGRALNRALDAYAHSATHPNVIKARLAFAQAMAGSGHVDEGIESTQSAIRDASSLFGPTCRLAGLGWKQLAELQKQVGRWNDSRESIEKAHSILVTVFCTDSPGYASLRELRAEIQLHGR
jgi:serine/threonine-protein kinase